MRTRTGRRAGARAPEKRFLINSLLYREERIGDITRLLRKWLLLSGIPAVVLGAGMVCFPRTVAGFLHLDRAAPVAIAGAVLPAMFWMPVLAGAAQGMQMFRWNSVVIVFGALVRLGLGAGLVWFFYPACGWAMLGHGLGIYTTAAGLFLGLLIMLRNEKRSEFALPSMRFYLLQSFFIQAAYVVLMTADVVLVKHYLPEDTDFAYAATLGRLVVFLPGAIVTAMFPKVASKGTATKQQQSVFLQSFGFTALCVVPAVLCSFLFPGPLVRALFGIVDASIDLKQMVGWMALVMGFSALLNVVMQFFLAQRRLRPCFWIILFSVFYLMSVSFFHAGTFQIIRLEGVFNALGFLWLAGIFFRTFRVERSGEKGV